MVVENHGTEPIHLHKGTTLGTVVPVEEVTPGDCRGGGEVCGLGSGVLPAVLESTDGVVHKTNAEPATGGEDSHLSASDGTTVGTLDTDMDRGSEVEDGETQQAGQPAAGPQRLGPPKDERTRRLLQQLTLQIEHLDPAQKSQLTGLITSFSDVLL